MTDYEFNVFLWRSTRDGCLRQKTHVNFCFGNCFSLQLPQIHHIAGKNGFRDSKNPVSISSLNQGNHNMGRLWIQTDHNLGHKSSDYGQPVTINMYDQTMISLESRCMYYDRVWPACFCVWGQPGCVYSPNGVSKYQNLQTKLQRSKTILFLVESNNDELIFVNKLMITNNSK